MNKDTQNNKKPLGVQDPTANMKEATPCQRF